MSVCSFCGCCLTGGVAIGIGLALVFPPDPAAVGTDGAVAELAGPGGRDRDVPAGRVVGGGTAGFAESFLPLLEADDHYGIGLLLDRWIDIDPGEAGEKLVEVGYLNRAFFAAWGAVDFDAALAMAQGFEKEGDRRRMVAVVLGNLLEKDPERLVAMLAELPPGLSSASLVEETFLHWAARDPESALERSQDFGGEEALRGVVRGWARRDPRAALEWGEGSGRGDLVSLIVSEWAKSEPAGALGYLGEQADPMADRDLAGKVLTELAASGDVAAALRWVQSHALRRGAYLAGKVLELAEGSPQEQWRLVAENMHGYSRQEAFAFLARGWSGEQFEAFFEAAREFPQGEAEEASGMMAAWAKVRFHEALAFAREIEDPDQRRAAMAGVLRANFSRTSLDLALQQVPEYRERIGAGPEYTDEEVAEAFLSGELREPGLSVHATEAGFSLVAPDDGARWIVSHPRADQLGWHARGLTRKWSDQEPKAASTWLATLDPSPVRDHAALGLVEAVVDADPRAAFEWALTIELPEERATALDLAFKTWRWSDPGAAESALEASSATGAERDRMLALEAGDGK